jgi:hypothetical protein
MLAIKLIAEGLGLGFLLYLTCWNKNAVVRFLRRHFLFVQHCTIDIDTGQKL